MDWITEMEYCMPLDGTDAIRWDRITSLLSGAGFSALRTVHQNPAFHGEDDVYTHTQMVCRELVRRSDFLRQPSRVKTELFLAALLHDIGKIKTTRMDEGTWVSPHHALTGSQIARRFLWRDCGCCGTRDAMAFRETVCALIRYHMLPVRLAEREEPERLVREVASMGELAPDFSWHLLTVLTGADAAGRIAPDIRNGLELVQLSAMMAEEAGCFRGPYPFASDHTKHAYFSGRKVQPDQVLFDDTWGEVILLSGLPGTGKDTWIRERARDMPVVSLDEIRKEMHIRPTDDQGQAVQTAKERAKAYLRRRQAFVWNATDLTRETRQKLIGLFERYGARVRIVYLEAAWNVRAERNLNRADAVPETAVESMLEKTVPPAPDEAQAVEWLCV